MTDLVDYFSYEGYFTSIQGFDTCFLFISRLHKQANGKHMRNFHEAFDYPMTKQRDLCCHPLCHLWSCWCSHHKWSKCYTIINTSNQLTSCAQKLTFNSLLPSIPKLDRSQIFTPKQNIHVLLVWKLMLKS